MLKLAHNPFEALNNPGIICGFSNRENGNMSLSYGDTKGVLENRQSFLSALDINYKDLVCAKQVHANRVHYVREVDRARGALDYEDSMPGTDGFITDARNLPLAIFSADCLSVFLYDPRKPAIGLLHAGWRSSKENIVSCAINLMRSKFNTDPADLFAGFGPCIRGCCYEVAFEFKDSFSSGLVERSGHFYLDLAEVNKKQLIDSGVKKDNIFDSGICTYCESNDFFSFRREKEVAGRMISVIALR